MPTKQQLSASGYRTLIAIGKAMKAEGSCDVYALHRNSGKIGSVTRLVNQGYVIREMVDGRTHWRLTELGIIKYDGIANETT